MAGAKQMTQEAIAGTDHIEGIICDFICNEIGADGAETLDADENLLTSGLVDSVAIVRLIGHVERELGVSVPAPDLVPANFRTIRVMAAYLHDLRGA
jgi:acyl carrier protein